jgi:hypothetical protein
LPLIGCYERVYDAAHVAAHKRQLVVRATLSVKSAPPEWQTTKVHPSVATGDLKMWVSGRKQSFDSSGNCGVQGDGLFCLGSLSAAEADECRSTETGFASVGSSRTTAHFKLSAGQQAYWSPSVSASSSYRLPMTAARSCI